MCRQNENPIQNSASSTSSLSPVAPTIKILKFIRPPPLPTLVPIAFSFAKRTQLPPSLRFKQPINHFESVSLTAKSLLPSAPVRLPFRPQVLHSPPMSSQMPPKLMPSCPYHQTKRMSNLCSHHSVAPPTLPYCARFVRVTCQLSLALRPRSSASTNPIPSLRQTNNKLYKFLYLGNYFAFKEGKQYICVCKYMF